MFEISTRKRLVRITDLFGLYPRTAYIDPALIDSIFEQLGTELKPTGKWVVYTTRGQCVTIDADQLRCLLDLFSPGGQP